MEKKYNDIDNFLVGAGIMIFIYVVLTTWVYLASAQVENKWIYSYQTLEFFDGEYINNETLSGNYLYKDAGEYIISKDIPSGYLLNENPNKVSYDVYETGYKEIISNDVYDSYQYGNRPLNKLSYRYNFIKPALAAIIRHGSVEAASPGNATSLTFAFDVGSSTNRVLVVTTSTNSATGLAVTYNGDSLVQKETSSTQCCVAKMWALDDPDASSNNVVISQTNSTFIVGIAVSYDDAGTVTTTANTSGTTADPSITITKGVSSSMIVDAIDFIITADTLDSPGASQTLAQQQKEFGNSVEIGMSDKSSGNNMGWNTTDAAGWDYMALEITQDSAVVDGGSSVVANGNLAYNIYKGVFGSIFIGMYLGLILGLIVYFFKNLIF